MPRIAHTCVLCGNSFYEWAYRGYKRCPQCRKLHPFEKTDLEQLYWDQRLSTPEIAKRLGSSKRQVLYWMKKYGIPRRSVGETRWPERKDIWPPSRETLYNLYWLRWLSYRDIADLYNVDPGAVAYWLRQYEIPSRSNWATRRKGAVLKEPTREELTELYWVQQLSTHDIGALYNISAHAIADRMKALEIPLRLPGYRQERFTCDDGHIVKSGLELRVDNWLNSHKLPHAYEPELPFAGKADFLVAGTYIEVWGITHNDCYQARIRSKQREYKKARLTLLGLYPRDILKNLDAKLNCLLLP